MTYQIKLPQFEGPFDLLLFFIERDEIDIYDIQISALTDEFLSYIHQMEMLNIDLASEFILVAATLMRIKAKMLLPRKELNEFGEEIDPRQELIERLLEYKRYKDILEELRALEANRLNRHKRGNIEDEMKRISEKYATESELETLSLYRLLQVFTKVMDKYRDRENRVQFQVVKYPFTIRTEKENLFELVSKQKEASFESLFQACENRVHAIFRFLAILELLQERILSMRIGLGFNNFWVSNPSE